MNPDASSIRVLVVDDSTLVREGLRAVIGSHGSKERITLVGEAASVASAVSEAKRLKPDVVLLDIRLPDGSGLDACREIRRVLPLTRVLILTSAASDELIHRAVVAGTHGYLMKDIDPIGLIRAIVDVASGKSVLTSEVTDRVLHLLREGNAGTPNNLSILSAQERRVLALVADGLTNKEVGTSLSLSENTVKNYLVAVFEKLQVRRRSQAAAAFVKGSSREETRPEQT
jgi:two-component system response regulator DevR